MNISLAQSTSISSTNSSKENTYGPTRPEEMLWTIAARLRFGKEVSRYQIMLALFKANPHAFQNSCNMNSLKPEVVLQIPSLKTILAIDRTEALQEVGKHTTQWQHRKTQPILCPPPPTSIPHHSSIPVEWPQVQAPMAYQEIEYPSIPELEWPQVQTPLVYQEIEHLVLDSDVQEMIKTQEPFIAELFLAALGFSSTEALVNLSQVIQQKMENILLESPESETTEVQKILTDDPLLGDTPILFVIFLLIGGIIIGGWVMQKLSLPHPEDHQFTKEPQNEETVHPNKDIIQVKMRKEQLRQLREIQTHGESYRFYPLTEAILVGSVTFIAIFLTSYFIFYHALEAQKDEIREGLVRTVQAMSTTIDARLHKTFTRPEQEDTEAYQNAIKPFAQILALNKQVKFIYTAILKENKIYFILDPTPKGDADGDGVEDSVDIMQEYDDPSGLLGEALSTQSIVVTKEPYTDQWGSLFGAYVPFYDEQGKFVGILGMDITADKYFKRLMPIKRATIRAIIAGFFIAFIVGSLVWFTRNFSSIVNRNRLLLIKRLKEQNENLFSVDTKI